MAALLPVLRHKRKASLAKGFVSIMISLALLHSGVIVIYLFSQKRVLACLVGGTCGLLCLLDALRRVLHDEQQAKVVASPHMCASEQKEGETLGSVR